MADANVLTPAAGPAGGATPAGGKRRIPWLIIIIGAAVLVAGIGGALVFLHGRSAAGHSKSAAAHVPSGPPHYLALDPPFVVNFQADQLVRFLQVSVEVMSRDPATLKLLKANTPVLRNDLLILFGNQKYATLSTPAGKEQLRADALAVIRKDLAQAGGDPKRLAAVYFTSFVMQ
ncbi:MAG: flagellar basal body protein FliL [Proteobacteria bacterium]|nr:flagellar basal body protein FliL [Pseudomonadota bacterium]